MTHPSPETVALSEALRRSLSQQSAPLPPSQLRLQLEAALGPEQARLLRRQVHQIVAAAEEHLPTKLTRVSPLSAAALARFSHELAVGRSWAPDTAERTTRIWADALGYADLAAAPWPPPPADAGHGSSRPPASLDAPPVAATAAPPGAVPAAPVAPVPPGKARESARESAQESAQTPAGPPTPAKPAAWPKPPRRLAAAHPASASGDPMVSVVQSYSGVPLALFAIAATALTVGLVAVYLLLSGVVAVVLMVAGFALVRFMVPQLGYGALVATEQGLEFVPYVANMRRPLPDQAFAAAWTEVAVEPGAVSAVRMAGRRIQVGPFNRAFARAAASRSAGSGP